MPDKKLTIYKSLDLHLPSIPQRSHLYSLEPIGVGTPYVESLTSYISRLAEAHCVTTRKLIFSEIGLLTGLRYLVTTNNSQARLPDTNTPALNGTKSMATNWVQALETLTQRTDLYLLTMLTWAEVISQRGLLRRHRAWCPLCYEEWRAAGQVNYEPLIWALDVVTVCPSHHQLLQICCPHCHNQLPLLTGRRSRSGFCPKCGEWLGASPQAEAFNSNLLSEDELKWQVWVIDNIGKLIATAPCLSFPMPKERIRKAISACVNQTVGGKVTTFAKLLGKHHKTLIRWHTGEEIPQLQALLQICHFLRISLLDFLTREVIAIDSNWIATQNQNQRQRKLEAHTRQPLDLERLRQALLAALKQEPPPTLTEVIRRLGYKGFGTFHKYFPDLCDQIKAQYTDYQKAKLEQKRLFLLSVLESNEFPPLSMKEVARRIGANDAALHMQFPSLSHAISARYLQYRKMVRVQKEEQLRTEIREIALALHAQGINPHSGNVGDFLTSPIVLRNQVGNAALREVQRELGYYK